MYSTRCDRTKAESGAKRRHPPYRLAANSAAGPRPPLRLQKQKAVVGQRRAVRCGRIEVAAEAAARRRRTEGGKPRLGRRKEAGRQGARHAGLRGGVLHISFDHDIGDVRRRALRRAAGLPLRRDQAIMRKHRPGQQLLIIGIERRVGGDLVVALDLHRRVGRRAVGVELGIGLPSGLLVVRPTLERIDEHRVVIDLLEGRPEEAALRRRLVNDVQSDQPERHRIGTGALGAVRRVVDDGLRRVVAAAFNFAAVKDFPCRFEFDRAGRQRQRLDRVEHAELVPIVAEDRGIFALVHQPLITQPAAGLIRHHAADGGDIGRRGDDARKMLQALRRRRRLRRAQQIDRLFGEQSRERFAVAPRRRALSGCDEDVVGRHLRLPDDRPLIEEFDVEDRLGGVGHAGLRGRPVEGDEFVPGKDVDRVLVLAVRRAGVDRRRRLRGSNRRRTGRAGAAGTAAAGVAGRRSVSAIGEEKSCEQTEP